MAKDFDFSVQSNGQTLYYKKTSDKEVSVVYPNKSGDDYYSGYTKPSGDLTIPQTVTDDGVKYTVTSIGKYAFEGCSGLSSVTIPESVTSIGESAFEGCIGLKSVTIPNSVTSISVGAFCSCSSLASIIIGNSVTSIGRQAFEGCSGLTSVSIPKSVTSIGGFAFNLCSGLESVTISNSVTSIDRDAFRSCRGLTKAEFASIESLCSINFGGQFANPLKYAHRLYIIGDDNEVKALVIPESVTSISCAFSGCSGLTSVTIPNTVTSIDEYAFCECTGLTSVTIPNSVTSIGEGAFRGCSGLASVTIPNSVKSIDEDAFYDCSNATLYCEVEETSKPGGWNSKWNDSGRPEKWGCKVIRAAVNDEEYGTVATAGENYAVRGDDGSLWYLKETTNGTATLTATPKDGYHFVKWQEEPDAAATLNIDEVTESKTYTAVFAKDEPTSIKNNSAGNVRKVTKVLGPDGLYIIKDGVKYNMLGEKVN
ncbi:MAG: leucine-rich repeat domain-containing protein [Bacteroidales bacterium]|nr:leucine-rich repeat domain-containing protein [Bacteroidales bacterium]